MMKKYLTLTAALLLVASVFGMVADPVESNRQIESGEENLESNLEANGDRVDFGTFEYGVDEIDLDIGIKDGKTARWVFYGDGEKLETIETNEVEFDWSEHGDFDTRNFKIEIDDYSDVLKLDWRGSRDEENLIGNIPTELSNLQDLEYLDFHFNEMSSEIPSELGELQKLECLNLREIKLSGEIPTELRELQKLEVLDLRANELSGGIPEWLGDLQFLKELMLSDNKLAGEIPSQLGGLENLEKLSLSHNELTGDIPSELGNLSDVKYLYLLMNDLSGEIPEKISDIGGLKSIDFGGNDLSGEIPAGFGDLSNLTCLSLHRNDLSGEIPATFGNLENLTELSLNGNQLSGEIPPEFSELTGLKRVTLQDNEIDSYGDGAFSTQPELGSSYGVLDLSNNALSSEAVDNILSDLVESLDLEERASAEVDLTGNSAPSEEGLGYKETLEDEGWQIQVSADGEDDIPGFTSLMLMLGVTIAVGIYRKKK